MYLNNDLTLEKAFEFLELSQNASKDQIAIRIIEKKEYFEYLIENSATDFLKRINAKNLEKLGSIQQTFFDWTIINSGIEVILPKDENVAEEPDSFLTTPIILHKRRDAISKRVNVNEPISWLIRHTENLSAIYFPVFPGKNFFGRKNQSQLAHFNLIEDDKYVSRLHAIIIAEHEETSFRYFIIDNDTAGHGSMSRNGTYLNADKNRIQNKTEIFPGDTIQIGVTKFFFRINDNPIDKLVAEVKISPYRTTVLV